MNSSGAVLGMKAKNVFYLHPRPHVRLQYIGACLVVGFAFVYMPLNAGCPWGLLLVPMLIYYFLISALLPQVVGVLNDRSLQCQFWLHQHLLRPKRLERPKAIIIHRMKDQIALVLILVNGKRRYLADNQFQSIEQVEELARWLQLHTGAVLRRT
jgi:hypothetical protein